MRQLEICGIGNAILDVLVRVDDALFDSLGLEKATMRLVDEVEQESLLKACEKYASQKVSGGSVANSIIACAQLGASTGFISRLGDDVNGRFYKDECEALGMFLPNTLVPGARSGTCLSIITPDAERTMRTCLGASSGLSALNVSSEAIGSSQWLFIEGYLLSNGEMGQGAVRTALNYAKASGTRVAFTVSESWVVTSFPDVVKEVVEQADLIFCNAAEACSLTGHASEKSAFDELAKSLPGVAVTAGAQGAFVAWNGEKGFVEAFPRSPVDLTGAGDMFAGAMLFGIVRGVPLFDTAKRACFLAGEVISRIGARLQNETKSLWEQCP